MSPSSPYCPKQVVDFSSLFHFSWRLQVILKSGNVCKVVGASLVAQIVKNLPAMWETQVRSLGQEDPLEKGMAIHSSILAWKIPWTEDPGSYSPIGLQRIIYDWVNEHFRTCKAVSTQSKHFKCSLLWSHWIIITIQWDSWGYASFKDEQMYTQQGWVGSLPRSHSIAEIWTYVNVTQTVNYS